MRRRSPLFICLQLSFSKSLILNDRKPDCGQEFESLRARQHLADLRTSGLQQTVLALFPPSASAAVGQSSPSDLSLHGVLRMRGVMAALCAGHLAHGDVDRRNCGPRLVRACRLRRADLHETRSKNALKRNAASSI
jgi:hypothetical protein